MLRTYTMLGGIYLFIAVAFGAFGAHALKARISDEMLTIWQTGVHYHMIHGLGLLLIGLIGERFAAQKQVRWAGRLLSAGIVIFSGSLYLLALSGVKVLGAITPIGGVCFLTGWALLVFAAMKQPR